MARKPATEAQKKAARRHIQKAAAALYAEQGAAAVSARAIAERAQVSVGTLYVHFGNLQGLMQSLWMEPVAAINAELACRAAETPEPIARLRLLLGAYVEVAGTRPDLFRGAFLFVRPSDLPKPERGPLEDAPFAALLIAAIRDGQAEGKVRAGDPRRLAQLVWSGVHGGLALPINFDRLAFAAGADIAEQLIEALLDHLRPPQGAPG